MGKRFVLVQSELEHLLAKSKQLGRSRDQERCRHSVSDNRDHVQYWKCWESNCRKAGAAKRRCGQWNNEITFGAGGIVHSAQVTVTNTDTTETTCPPKGSEVTVKAFRLLTWSMIIPGIFSAVNQTRVTRQRRPLATQRHEVRHSASWPWLYPAVSLHSVWQKSCSVLSLSGSRCKLFCRKLISLASLTEESKDEPDYSKVTRLPNKDVFHALSQYLERGDPTRWAKARLREVSLSAVCGKHFASHSSGCELALGGDYERTCQHMDIDIFESVYYNVDQFLAYLQL